MKSGSYSDHYIGESGKQYCASIGQGVLNHLGYRLQARLFEKYLGIDDFVLDFGCANGSMTIALKSSVRQIEGLEINEASRELAIQQGLTVWSNLEAIPSDQKYDKIVSNHVLEHIPNVYGVLIALREKLRAGGRLIIVVPIADIRQPENRIWRKSDLDRHLHSWTPLLFGNLLDEAGFVPEELRIATRAWHPQLFFLGDGILQDFANYLLGAVKCRRELVAVAVRKD